MAMPMPADQIESLIREGIPDARVEIVDLAGDGDHYEARVVAESFRGQPLRQPAPARLSGAGRPDGQRAPRAEAQPPAVPE